MNLSELQEFAGHGVPEAQYAIAICYENGIGVGIDAEEARKWYGRAAAQGFSAAQYEMSKLLASDGENRLLESVRWLKIASENNFAPAQFLMSLYYESGVGLDIDLAESFRESLRAAKQGYAPAIRRTALMFEEGRGVPIDLEEAFRWHERSAEAGEVDSFASIGRMYANGLGVERNSDRALEWFLKGSEAGSPWACLSLAAIYRFGELGQSIDSVRADELNAKATDLMEQRKTDSALARRRIAGQ